MLGISVRVLTLALVSMACQVAALSMLPKTQGFTSIGYTLAFMALYTIAFATLAQMLQSGVNLGVILPLFSATIPLMTIGLGVALYGESASPQKVSMLVAACVLVGLASRY